MAVGKRTFSVWALLFLSILLQLSGINAARVRRQSSSISIVSAETALLIAVSSGAADEAVAVLNQHNQATDLLVMPQNGAALPTLETINGTDSVGNFGLIIIIGMASYDYGGTVGWASAITSDQWTALYAYQSKYGVRMIHLDGYPGNFVGTALAPGQVAAALLRTNRYIC